ncbi:hypothetical protein FHR84_001992 [Actinopolyspora biskrensis]|uniref:Uncharacterized protein n=1 Tax=Actinopolyspora biskrensis TaxID=1470178 RepID=A0A852Z882_9ACTN|nr:hypothetical protein [Actinopolyspora biskrensis]NYH78667.1 hypothetical protein [Actinopolyspora biskrensis]
MTHLIVALLAGALGTLLGLSFRRSSGESTRGWCEERRTSPAAGTVPNGEQPSNQHRNRDRWLCELNRCEQAVRRAVRAADTVSSLPVRRGLRQVVYRMDAELPTVRTLVELGREFDSAAPEANPGGDGAVPPEQESSSRRATSRRLHRQVREASAVFTSFADRLTEVVAELGAEADPDHAQTRIAGLRARFPLLPSMSEILAGREERTRPRSTPEAEALVETR